MVLILHAHLPSQNAYTLTFASFLLFWGRVSDIYSPIPVFIYGFLTVGFLNLIISFMTNSYAFFFLRAIAGIAAASVVPSAYRLIGSIFPPEERSRAYTLYGMSGSIANVSGVILAGVISLIKMEGQGRSWRWFFRIVAAIW
jgi:MFS family permease